MKIPQNRIGKLLGTLVLGGLMTSPALLFAQENAPRPTPPPPPREGMPPQGAPQNPRIQRVMGQVQALRQAGKHDEARQLEMRVRAAMGDRAQVGRPQDPMKAERKPRIQAERRQDAKPGQPMPPRAKIQHLKQAADHLQAAGYEDQAAKARQEIGRIVAEARRDGGADANAGMKEEMTKLRREMEELRNQIRQLKAGAPPKHDPGAQPKHNPGPPPSSDRRPE